MSNFTFCKNVFNLIQIIIHSLRVFPMTCKHVFLSLIVLLLNRFEHLMAIRKNCTELLYDVHNEQFLCLIQCFQKSSNAGASESANMWDVCRKMNKISLREDL